MDNRKLCGDLVIELTRRCNMNCKHCLRGPAENKDIDLDLIYQTISKYHLIRTLTLTGGEPSLVPEIIAYVFDCIEMLNVSLASFYVVTNGKQYSEAMVRQLYRAYSMATEPELCVLTVSVDQFHDDNYRNMLRYEMLPFYRDDKTNPDIRKYLINEGNAYTNGIGVRNLNPKTEINCEYTNTYIEDGDWVFEITEPLVYLSAVGDVLLECDLSYYNQEMYAIGNLRQSDFMDIIAAHVV